MKKLLVMYARYTQQANAQVFHLLDQLSPEKRNADRKSYYKSLAGLTQHNIGSILFFHGMIRPAFPENKALASTASLQMPEGDLLNSARWEQLKDVASKADQATVELLEGLNEQDLNRQLPIDWYGGNPATVPLHYILNIATVHGVHHRGQISQILDEMGITNDFSGIDVGLLQVMKEQ